MPASCVSVVMPFLNVAPYLAEAIESVRAQTYPHWELLLIDDGSTDGSTGIAQHFAALEPERIRWIEHAGRRNLGASASRNVGLRLASGEYLAMLDGDDVWLSHKLSEQVALLEACPAADVLCGSTEFWYGWTGLPDDVRKDQVVRIGVPDGSFLRAPEMLMRMVLGCVAVPCTCSLIARRDVALRVGGFEEQFRRVYTDQAFYAKLFLDASILIVDVCWDRYRQHPVSSCIVAERSGELTAARVQYLRWLEGYVSDHPRGSADVNEAVRRALWRTAHPLTTEAIARFRTVRRRTIRFLRTAAGTARRQFTLRRELLP